MKDYNIKMKKIYKSINNHDCQKALQGLATIIMILNIEIIRKNYMQDFKKMNFYDAMEIYRIHNKKIYDIMIDINYIFEIIKDQTKIEENNIIELNKLCDKLKKFDTDEL